MVVWGRCANAGLFPPVNAAHAGQASLLIQWGTKTRDTPGPPLFSTVFHWSSAAEFTGRVMGGREQGVQPVGLQMSREQTAHNLPHTMYNVNKPRTCNI